MAELNLGVDSQEIEKATLEDPLTAHDPTCGSGRLLIAFAKAIHKEDPDAPVVVSGIDKSRVCAKMSVINLVLAGQSGWIIHGNSLTLDFHTKWYVGSQGVNSNVTRIDDPEQPRDA